MIHAVREIVDKAFKAAAEAEGWNGHERVDYDVAPPKDETFGDFSLNLAMTLASKLKKNPREIAARLAGEIEKSGFFSSVTIAGPGFINMTAPPEKWADELAGILEAGDDFGKSDMGRGEKVIVEFVSANPTGPLHIGHGRGAAVGDTLARLLRWTGYDVHTEYYINDAGLQMDNLGKSTIERAKELLGRDFEEPPYKGDYIKQIARSFLDEKGEDILESEDALDEARRFTASAILAGIKKDLADFRVHYDEWFSEASLHEAGSVEKLLEELKEAGSVYEKDGALWLRTGTAGDEKDRVVRRANGAPTYLAADIAYHKNKLDRGFSKMVDIWGADHHGYIPRMKAAIAALGSDPERLVVRLSQMVNLKRGGEVVAMSTRGGVFTTLREIMDEVGVDAARYFFLMRSADSHMDFDVDLAKKQSEENPVYYIQYAHARCANIFVTAREREVEQVEFGRVRKELLGGESELSLIKGLSRFPEVAQACAENLQAPPLTQHLTDIAARFHYFYKHHRVVTGDLELTRARLALTAAVRIVLKNGLRLLGVAAPDRM
ncbi:MAG: arginine--tRNA ligase [Candidatus Nitrospinota bacterium M3_3B_026]